MRFLCLHGMGTNGRIFESQTAAIRHSLGDNHTYEWLEGSIETDMAPGIKDIVSKDDKYLLYADDSPESQIRALTELAQFIEQEGPFDVLMGFSHGAGCLATYLLYKLQQGEVSQLPIRCAIFFCGAPPHLPSVSSFSAGEECIEIPTAHIWGRNDTLYRYGPELSRLCRGSMREEVVLESGHEIPGARDLVSVARCVRAIRRTLARASVVQM